MLDLITTLAYWERLISSVILSVVIPPSHRKFLCATYYFRVYTFEYLNRLNILTYATIRCSNYKFSMRIKPQFPPFPNIMSRYERFRYWNPILLLKEFQHKWWVYLEYAIKKY